MTFLWALCTTSSELLISVANRAWLAARDEESPRLFQTHHAADRESGRVVAFGKENLKPKR
jgi:hypothetical protein